MGTPGPVALILVALAVLLAAGVLVARGRRRAAAPAGPRTVAELVRLRAERAAGSGADVTGALPGAVPVSEPGTAVGPEQVVPTPGGAESPAAPGVESAA